MLKLKGMGQKPQVFERYAHNMQLSCNLAIILAGMPDRKFISQCLEIPLNSIDLSKSQFKDAYLDF